MTETLSERQWGDVWDVAADVRGDAPALVLAGPGDRVADHLSNAPEHLGRAANGKADDAGVRQRVLDALEPATT